MSTTFHFQTFFQPHQPHFGTPAPDSESQGCCGAGRSPGASRAPAPLNTTTTPAPRPASGSCRRLPLELPGCSPGALLPASTQGDHPPPQSPLPPPRQNKSWSVGWAPGPTGPLLGGGGEGPGASQGARARSALPGAASRGNPASKRRSRSLPPAGARRAHPDPGTREPRALLGPCAARRSSSCPPRSFSGPLQGGARGAPEASPARPPPPPSQPAHPTRAAWRGAALGFREGSAARSPWRPQSCPAKWRCSRGRRGRAARETPRQPAPCACGRCPSSWSPACCSW